MKIEGAFRLNFANLSNDELSEVNKMMKEKIDENRSKLADSKKAIFTKVKKTRSKPNLVETIEVFKLISKKEEKYQKKEIRVGWRIENLMKRVELLKGQVTQQLEKFEKHRAEYKTRFETGERDKRWIQRDVWKIESRLDQEQVKRDQVEIKMEQLKRQISDFNRKIKSCNY